MVVCLSVAAFALLPCLRPAPLLLPQRVSSVICRVVALDAAGPEPPPRGTSAQHGEATGGGGGSPLFSSLKAARSTEEVARLVEQLRPRTARDYTVCISAYGRVRDWRSATETLGQMRRCGVEPDVISYNAAIRACREGGPWQRALELLEGMPQRALPSKI